MCRMAKGDGPDTEIMEEHDAATTQKLPRITGDRAAGNGASMKGKEDETQHGASTNGFYKWPNINL